MIKYLMRKTVYNEFDHETQDVLFKLISKQHIIQFLCEYMFLLILYFSPIIPGIIIVLCKEQLSLRTQIILIIYLLIHIGGFMLFIKYCREPIFIFSGLIADKLYFLACTVKGKALLKEDFENIKSNDDTLYDYISSRKCHGYCYSTCFNILKTLGKGSIEFVAIKSFFPINEKETEKPFTMHVLYINNGWAFDTYSIRQYPIEKLHKYFSAKVYKSFSFDEIAHKSYEKFREEQEPELAEWCNNNNCSQFWKEKES